MPSATVAEMIRDAVTAVDSVAGTNAERARRTADVLDRALELHQHHGDGDCPVCGRTGALDPSWHEKAKEEIVRLREEAATADKAHRDLQEAEKKARALIADPPFDLAEAEGVGIDVISIRELWPAWIEVAEEIGV